MLGLYENFPQNIHYIETLTYTTSKQKIQQRIAQTIEELNSKTSSFEEAGNPTVPNCSIIFEFGVADTGNFTFLSKQEAKKLEEKIASSSLHTLDWFCAIRYYRNTTPKRPLKFDYYMIRFAFEEKKSVQISVFHERGPRYLSPEDVVSLITNKANGTQKRTVLKRQNS